MARNTWVRLMASWAWVGIALVMVGLLLPWLQAQEPAGEMKGDKKAKQASKEARTVMAEFSDSGQLQLVLEFDRLDIDSPYGKLSIPVEEIESIELATRLPPNVHKQIDEAVFSLGSVDFAARERAEKDLLALAEKAYPLLLVATKHADLEVARRAQELAARIRESVPAEKLEVRELDVVTTNHSTISGKISTEVFKVETAQFGSQQLRLSDVRSLRSQMAEAPEEASVGVQPDPGSLSGVGEAIGKTLAFTVTGRADGIVWGTGVYTTDSTLATAAVHAGALKVGETGVVRVTILPPPPAFAGSTQNGVTSSPYGAYPAAYQVLVPKAKAKAVKR